MKRPIRIVGDIAYIPLTKGYEAIIDAADVHLVEEENWSALVSVRADGEVRTVYAQHRIGGRKRQTTIYLHRRIFGDLGAKHVDHIDGDGLNNRRSNLRLATHEQNMANRGSTVRNKSGFKGVFWNKRSKKWAAVIGANRNKHRLGMFGCATAASIAYARASRELHGEFGRTA